MEEKLYEKDQFSNINIPYLFNREITEYDMKDAGFSITKEFELLPEMVIKDLEGMGKEERKKRMGIYQRDNEDYKKDTKVAFSEARRLFFEANDLEESDIISIKKDAIFTTKKCKIQKVGRYIEFRPKNIYTSYIYIGNKLEMYYNPEKLDIKGIGKEQLKFHEYFMLKFLKQFFNKMETEDGITVIEFTKRFIDKYKRRELEVGYYREFNSQSKLKVIKDGDYESEKSRLDISVNYNLLIKLIQIPL